ncbi:MAG: 2-succinyl-5-enolpyruvyl-6-hydroxy-3-cyclohexene-1-carboxylic-acid synthase [Candidatus Omnitrophica bacterium]|nr:2-succinyl-5-enolpyruvyl-6-hydroxy-3-cyclohexene-1-carboxylic-acid synthase [Candidatus Omnitrophota bacterium]
MIEELLRLGVDYFCVAPGSRNSPLSIALAQNKKAVSCVHFDERGLAFHAMGYAAATHKPTVLISTSGTAAANFFPAIIEASKKKLPMIVLTADRPPELRQTGALQTIDQVGLFGKHVQWAHDMPCPDRDIPASYVLTTMDQAWYQALRHRGVVHINCMYRPPLALESKEKGIADYIQSLEPWSESTRPLTDYVDGVSRLSIDVTDIVRRLEAVKNGVIVVGKIAGDNEAKWVLKLAAKLGWPVFPDISSGLRLGHQDIHLIHYFDAFLSSPNALKNLSFDGILHLGGRMTSKRYYEFAQNQKLKEYVMVLNHSLRNDPNHQVSLRIEASVTNFVQKIIGHMKPGKISTALEFLSKANRETDKTIDAFWAQYERISEPGVARLVSRLIPKNGGLFLSNSMPIRDMASFADFKGPIVRVNGNRGASGIDGIIASASGYARGLKIPVTLMIGDLAALHDLNSLSLLRTLEYPLIIVVLNNGGGGIFSFLPISEFKEGFEKFWSTPHPYTLGAAASMFELNYCMPQDGASFMKAYKAAFKTKTSTIIEVMTTRLENLKVHRLLQEAINNELHPT